MKKVFDLTIPFDFSNFLIITSSPNLSFNISCALPIQSINPKFFALLPDQNSPEKSSTPDLINFDPLPFSTTSIKSL